MSEEPDYPWDAGPETRQIIATLTAERDDARKLATTADKDRDNALAISNKMHSQWKEAADARDKAGPSLAAAQAEIGMLRGLVHRALNTGMFPSGFIDMIEAAMNPEKPDV